MRSVAINIPTVLTVLGATGDLMAKKIVPALLHLFESGLLPERFRVIGLARREWNDRELQNHVAKIVAAHRKLHPGPAVRREFLALWRYQPGEFSEIGAFQPLAAKIRETDAEWGLCANKLFYLAVPPEHYQAIFENLARAKLNRPCGGEMGWTRLMVEKPFGFNLVSARALQKLLGKYFKEEQIYRLDHYLAKEIAQGIIHWRFSNNLLERVWDKSTVARIELKLLEAIGVEGRGAFYDSVGALRDVGQNHLLEMLALITMAEPSADTAQAQRASRADLLARLAPWSPSSLVSGTYRAQYNGYRDIPGVAPHSNTETYFKLETTLAHPRWAGVPISIEAGKRCQAARKEMVVTLKHPPACFGCGPTGHVANRVVFSLEPEDRITIHFFTKRPGYGKELEERTLDFFLYPHKTAAQYVEEYAVLLSDCIRGDQSLFVSVDEVEASWRFIDPVARSWRKNSRSLKIYAPGVTPLSALAKPAGAPAPEITLPKTIGIIGLGKMGASLARHLLERGWMVVGHNRSFEPAKKLALAGLLPAFELSELIKKIPAPRVIWLMLPAGRAVDEVLFGQSALARQLKRGDLIIDGGNSYYQDTIRRFKRLDRLGIKFIDVGVSGGPSGARWGASLMIGGSRALFNRLEPLYRDLSEPGGYQFFAGVGAGHFAKMVHNGIEYGMMQALAEGFTILKAAKYKLDLARLADVYNHGSVIESRLAGWLQNAFNIYGQELRGVSGVVGLTGEGAWTAQTARALKLQAKIIAGAVKFRQESARHPSYTGKILSALRQQFGGHEVK